MFLVQARGTVSSLSIGTDCAAAALLKLDEMLERGMREVVVLDGDGEPFSREELERLSGRIEEAA